MVVRRYNRRVGYWILDTQWPDTENIYPASSHPASFRSCRIRSREFLLPGTASAGLQRLFDVLNDIFYILETHGNSNKSG